jgi:calcineurin-like phosphoesterase family protein
VLGHLLFGTGKKFRGQTHSYDELQEVEEDGEKILIVTYSDKKKQSRVEYRRCRPNRKSPEERQQDDET